MVAEDAGKPVLELLRGHDKHLALGLLFGPAVRAGHDVHDGCGVARVLRATILGGLTTNTAGLCGKRKNEL